MVSQSVIKKWTGVRRKYDRRLSPWSSNDRAPAIDPPLLLILRSVSCSSVFGRRRREEVRSCSKGDMGSVDGRTSSGVESHKVGLEVKESVVQGLDRHPLGPDSEVLMAHEHHVELTHPVPL